MGKQPAFFFFPNDWVRDVQAHSLELQGAWMRLLCQIWWEPTKEITLTSDGFARLLGVGRRKSDALVGDVLATRLASGRQNGDGTTTLWCRRWKDEVDKLVKARERDRRYKERRAGDEKAIPPLPKATKDSCDDAEATPLPKAPYPKKEKIKRAPKGALSGKPDDTPPFEQIIAHLNQAAGTSYRHQTKATQSHIQARWREGFRLEQFIQVINHKVREWQGTEYEKFLCPDTLFGTKFEKYLNQSNGREAREDAQVERVLRLARAEREGGQDIEGDAPGPEATGTGGDDA